MTKYRKIFALSLVIILELMPVSAQREERFQSAISWSSEVEWNMKNGETNFVNLLTANVEARLWQGATWQAGLLATDNLRLTQGKSWSVANDRQVFSNLPLDAGTPVILSLMGVSQCITPQLLVFAGLRNMNVDYFATPYTALFTQSSDGIFPTIADNFGVANYPAAALALHVEWEIAPRLLFKNSLYNGQSSDTWEYLFRVAPKADGILHVTEVSYNNRYHVGAVYGSKQKNHSLYALVEQPVTSHVGLLLQGGYTPKDDVDTYGYMGAGLIVQELFKEGDALGLQSHRALYNDGGHETDIEVTYRIEVIKHVSVQPALHFIRTSGKNFTVGLMRCCLEL